MTHSKCEWGRRVEGTTGGPKIAGGREEGQRDDGDEEKEVKDPHR